MKKIIIVTLLVIAQLGAFYLKSHAQTKTQYIEKAKSVEIGGNAGIKIVENLADETTLTWLKNSAKIETDNEKVFMKLLTTHQQLLKRYTCTWKKDRHGSYKHYAIYLNKEDAEIVKSWAKTNL